MAKDNLSGHTSAQNSLGADGLRDGDSLSPSTLTNLLQGIQGNGILRLQDGAYGSTRNEPNSGSQPGSIIKNAGSLSILDVSGGFVVLDGVVYEFGNGHGNTIQLDLNNNSHGTGALQLNANEEAIYTIFVSANAGNAKVHYEGGSPIVTTAGLYPSASSNYLTTYASLSSADNHKVVVLAHVRVQHTVAAGGGAKNIDIISINDKRAFVNASADYRIPLSTGSITNNEVLDGGTQGVNTIADLNGLFTHTGDITKDESINVHWVSHPNYGSFNQSPPSSSDAGYGQGPSRGADRGGSHAADSFYFAGRNNEQTGHYSVRLQGRGVDATATALTTPGTWVLTADGDSFLMLSPNGGVTITLNPERDATANYKFPEGHIIEVCNDGAGSIVFDNQTSPSGLNATLLAGHRATFIYEGTVWIRCDYQSAILGITPAIVDNSGTPAFATGITKTEVQALLSIEDGADVTDTANVTAAGALMDSEVTNLAFVKGLASGISNGNVLVANAAVADNDFLKIDGTSVEGRTAAEMRSDLNVADGATANAGTVTGVTGTLPISSTGGATPAISIAAATTGTAGSMSGADKTKLDTVATNANVTDATTVNAAGAVMESDVDAKGDIFVATANNTLTRLAVGTNNHVLTADSAQASGVKWAAASGGGGGGSSISDADSDTKIDVETSTDDDKIIMTSAGTDLVEVEKGSFLAANSMKLLNETAITFHATDSASNSLTIACPTSEMAGTPKTITINQGTTAGDTLLTAAGFAASANSTGSFGSAPTLQLGAAGNIGNGVFEISKLHAFTLQSTIFTANRTGSLNDTGQYIIMTGSGLTYTLISNASLGAQLTILAGSTNAVTVTATGGKTINGGSANGSITVAGYNGVTLI